MIRTNLNPMGSGPPMALSERLQHAAPGPLLALYMESLNGWSGLPVAQYGNLRAGPLIHCSTVCEVLTCGLGHCMGNPKRASPGLSWHCL